MRVMHHDHGQSEQRGQQQGSSRPTAEAQTKETWGRLFRDLAAGKRQAIDELYDASARKLYGLALWRTGCPEDAGDVVQEVFVRLVEQRNRLSEVRDPHAWLLSVTHRAAVDVTRRRKRRAAQPLDEALFLAAPSSQPERRLDGERASALLGKLPPAQRSVIYLRHFAGCTFKAIASITGIPTFTAASRYRLGIKKLRRLMEGKQ